MKVLFAGPSLWGAKIDLSGLDLRPPAVQGDVLCAVLDGAAAIGLIDGSFEATAAVWHKEILFALSEGVAVLGGASMGALRAAECEPFGMQAIGVIAARYLSGSLDDDAAVAIQTGPAELGSPPLTEALVDAEATIENLTSTGLVTELTARRMTARARSLFFKERTPENIVAGERSADELLRLYLAHRVSLKQNDGLELVLRLRTLPEIRTTAPADWTMAKPAFWQQALAVVREEQVAGR